MNATFRNPLSGNVETRFCGLLSGKLTDSVSGPNSAYYFLDIKRPGNLHFPRMDYYDDIVSNGVNPYACYIARNFYPSSIPVQPLDTNRESAAVQLAVWNFTDGMDPNTITDTLLRARTLAIVSDALTFGGGCVIPVTVEFVADEDPEYFSLRTTNGDGFPTAVDSIHLSFDLGTLSSYFTSTLFPEGLSERIQVFGANTGYIDAFSKKFIFPKGSLFRHDSTDFPRIILVTEGFGARSFVTDWGTLPVELTSFSWRKIEDGIAIDWSTSAEINNSYFDIQRKSSLAEWMTVGRVNGKGNSNSFSNYSFEDKFVPPGAHRYRLKQTDYNGNFEYFELGETVTVDQPQSIKLYQNFPNPFNPSTSIRFRLDSPQRISLVVYDIRGAEVARLAEGVFEAGYHQVVFGKGSNSLPSGTYFCRLVSGKETMLVRMVLTK